MTKLWKHQVEAIAYGLRVRDAILHMGMGTGKSRCAVEILLKLIEGNRGARMLLGCPRAVMAAWAKQFMLWAPHVRVILLDKGTAKQKAAIVEAALADTTAVVIVGNYETLWRMDCLERQRWDCLIWDEVHRLKSPSGAASKWAAKLAKKNPRAKRLGLSGTLLAHSLLDAFGVYRAMESPECPTFGPFFTAFRNTYAVCHPLQRGWVVGYKNQDEFAKKIAATTFHRRSEDVLDLPELMFEDVVVDLGPKEARVYADVEKNFCTAIEQGTMTAANAMVVVLRLQQICGGFLKLDDELVATQIEDAPAKRAAIVDLLEDMPTDEPVVIFCRFRSDIESCLRACQQIGRSASELSGRIDSLAAWQAGETAVLVAQIQSGGIGIDLTRARYGIFFSLGHSLAEYLQAIARLHRPGQTRTTHVYHLVARLPHGASTVDARVYQALSERKEVIDAVLDQYRA